MTPPLADLRCPRCGGPPAQDLTDRGVYYPHHYDHRWRCDLHCCVAVAGSGTTPEAAADLTRRQWAACWPAPPAQEPA